MGTHLRVTGLLSVLVGVNLGLMSSVQSQTAITNAGVLLQTPATIGSFSLELSKKPPVPNCTQNCGGGGTEGAAGH